MPRSLHDHAIVVRLLPQLTTWSTSQQDQHITYNQQGRVSSLNLAKRGLTTLFPEVGQLSELQWLDLSDNQLTSVPEELSQLSQLQDLLLDHNQLTSVPEELSQLSQLLWLDLSHNQLTALPRELGQLTQLKDFNLADNPNLHHPPPDVVAAGTEAILTFLCTGGRMPPNADLASKREPT